MVFDGPDDTDASSVYECLRCGVIVTSDSHPVDCPDCGGVVQNRAMSLE